MSRFSKIILFAAALAMAAACGDNAKVEGTLAQAPSAKLVVKSLNHVIDTVQTNADGAFSFKVDVAKGQPEFVYLYHGDIKVASLLVEAGDKVTISADTLGNWSVEGSEESLLLQQVEKDHADVMARMYEISSQMESEKSETKLLQLRKELGQEYVDYYRKCVRYVLGHSTSLTVVPVFFQNLGENLPVFSQATDAIHFRSISDSLALVYPESKYVKSLKDEADRRFGYLELESRIKSAQEVGFVDVELPDITGVKQKLSEVDSKVVMLYFWNSADASQKMFNLDFLKSLYDDYHVKGFQIYQASLDVDKARWARVVKEQQLPWINVCDARGASSPYIGLYNLPVLPAVFIIKDGELVDGQAVDEKSMRKLIGNLLK